jgi:Family of unknown function (DUF695)
LEARAHGPRFSTVQPGICLVFLCLPELQQVFDWLEMNQSATYPVLSVPHFVKFEMGYCLQTRWDTLVKRLRNSKRIPIKQFLERSSRAAVLREVKASDMTLKLDEIGWTITEVNTGMHPYRVRFRRFDVTFPKQDFPIRVNIFWSMIESDDQGYPTSAELERLHVFENRLVEAEEQNNFSVFAMTVTGRNQREFVFYTPEPHEFVKRIALMPQQEERYPIEIYRSSDVAWEYFENETKKCRKV